MLNIDLIKTNDKNVVRCREKWQAVSFIEELDRAVGNVYKGAISWWDRYEDRTCYWPRFSLDNFHIEYCDEDWFIEHGYKVLEFDDVYFIPEDYGKIEVGDIDIASLFDVV